MSIELEIDKKPKKEIIKDIKVSNTNDIYDLEEVQEIKDAISSNIRKDKLRNLVYKSDVTTLLQDGLEKVIQGLTTFEEVLKVIELDDDNTVGKYDLNESLENIELAKKDEKQKEENNNSSYHNNIYNEKEKEDIKKDNKDDMSDIFDTNEKSNEEEKIDMDDLLNLDF